MTTESPDVLARRGWEMTVPCLLNKFLYGPVAPHMRILPHMPPERGDIMVFENPDHGPGDEREDDASPAPRAFSVTAAVE